LQTDLGSNVSLLAVDDRKATDTRMVISPWAVSFYAEKISPVLLWLI